MPDFARERERMVQRQIASRGVADRRVLDAMLQVPREQFVSGHLREFAYEDSPLPIEEGQTISQPYIVALMIESAQIGPGDRVLEIGAGSGYAAAVMSLIAGQVYAIERHASLADSARARLDRLGYGNIEIRAGDGTRGWPEAAPFDAILAAAGGPEVPEVLRRQLAVGGRLVMPVGETAHLQRLVKLTRTGPAEFRQEDLAQVRFVPLIGEYGWTVDARAPAQQAAQAVRAEPDAAAVAPGGGPPVSRSKEGAPAARTEEVVPAARNEEKAPASGTEEAASAARIEEPAWAAHTGRTTPVAPAAEASSVGRAARPATLAALIRDAAEPLADLDDPAFGHLFDRFADARVVLLGECSHGTSEFYRARARITRRLIEAHGFTIVAVEADWPDAAWINRDVRGLPARENAEPPFQRFPTWMWRNTDVDAFTGWLREHNRPLPSDRQAGFYGLDLYNMHGSMRAVIDYLDQVDPEAARVARARYGCLTPWQNEPQTYGRTALSRGYAPCEQAVVSTLRELLDRQLEYAAHNGETFLDATANARLVRNAEAYYRAMYYGAAESWNLRDRHMFETLCQLLDARGPRAKAVVWAHNSHIGDARFTDMGTVRGELNIGQLCRERFGAQAALIGFGTHAGTVAAADDWDEPMQVMRVNPSRPDSYERLAHDSGTDRFLLDLREGRHDELRGRLLDARLERFIGVIYRPDTERWSHYAQASLPRQFDAYVWFDETAAVTPLPGARGESPSEGQGEDETYPFGL